MSFEVRYYVDNSVTRAFFGRKFYGAGATGQADPLGFPRENFTDGGLEVPSMTDISQYEITQRISAEVNCTTTSGDETVTASASTFNNGDGFDASFVGAYIYSGADPQNLVFLGVVASVTDSTHVELTADALSVVTGVPLYYQLSGTTNFEGFKVNRSFFALIKTLDDGFGGRIIPRIKEVRVGDSISESANVDTGFIALNRVSAPGVTNAYIMPVPIAATVRRHNGYIQESDAYQADYFRSTSDIPFWVCWEINPYGNTATTLNKKTIIRLSVTEALPETDVTSPGFGYTSAVQGWI